MSESVSNPNRSSNSSLRVVVGSGLMLVVLIVVVGLFVRGLGQAGPVDAPPDPLLAQEALDEARQWLNQNKPAQAESVLASALADFPEDQDLLVELGKSLSVQGKLEESYRAFERAVAIGPDSAELRDATGNVANGAGFTREALDHFTMAQHLDKTSAKYPLYLAQVQRKLDMISEAKASLLLCINLDGSIPEAWATLADIALQENALTIARQHVDRARTLDPSSVVIRLLDSRITRRENKPEQALQMILAMGESVVLSERSLIDEAALCYGLLRRPADAAELYARGVEEHPDSAPMMYEAALWYDRAGVEDAALVYAQRAARIGHEEARQLADRLATGD
ncbi:MAG: tetratricopeptide repeat protein [Planctomycetota bacterium]|jgi:tetratricopeptide (TPR) repeat protein